MSCDCWDICERERSSGVSARLDSANTGGGGVGRGPGGSMSSNLALEGEGSRAGEVLERESGDGRVVVGTRFLLVGGAGKRENEGEFL